VVKRMVRTATRDLELLDLLLLTYWVTVGLMQALFSREILEVHGAVALAVLLVADAAMVAAILLVARRVKQWETGRRLTAKSVLVFFTFYLGFQLLPFYALAVHPHSYEAELLWFDRLLVGQSISAFLDPYLMPGVADFMQLCYATHYLLPFILLGLLLSAGRNQEAEWLATAVAFVVLTGFLLYVLVPALSPVQRAGPPGARRGDRAGVPPRERIVQVRLLPERPHPAQPHGAHRVLALPSALLPGLPRGRFGPDFCDVVFALPLCY
jgi:hypothetical protein